MSDRPSYKQHISAQFNAELDAIKNDLLEMGGKVENQIELAAEALLQRDSGPAESVITIDRAINRMEVDIDEQCARILARRQPAASDLRLIIAIAKVTTDLERIGDEASKIARVAMKLAASPVNQPSELRVARIAAHVNAMLGQALDAFARQSVEQAVRVVLSDSDIDDDYQSAMAEIRSAMAAQPDNIEVLLDQVWALRSLERIGDHASNIAEQVVYLARGVDIRHTDSVGLRNLIN